MRLYSTNLLHSLTAGIIELWPMMTSRTAPATNSAQEDFWTFELRVTTKVLNSIV